MSTQGIRIALIITGVGLAGGWGAEWAAHQTVKRRYEVALQTQRTLELELAEVRAEHERVAEVLAKEEQRSGQLASALLEKDQVLQQTMARLAHEDLITQELQDRLLAMQRQFDEVQGELAVALQSRTAETAGAGGGMVQLEKVVVSQPAMADAASQGHVVSVHPEWKFVVIDLGWDAVRIGDVVSIYRDEALLGKARVERVQEQVSAVTLLPDWMQTEVRVNDIVRVL